MSHKIIYAAAPRERPRSSPLIQVLRVCILVGVWFLVGLAGLTVWIKLFA